MSINLFLLYSAKREIIKIFKNKIMRNRDIISRQLDMLEGKLIILKQIVNTQSPITEYNLVIDSASEILDSVKSYIELEELS